MKLSPSGWQALRELAGDLGFHDLGAVPAGSLADARAQAIPGAPRETGLREWLGAGRHGEMDYMARDAAARENPLVWWPGARTVIAGLVAHDAPGEPGEPAAGDSRPGARARVSRYAWGRDYHLVVKSMLMALGRRLEREVVGSNWRTCVDRGSAMEKPHAVLAGLGWLGKHGNVLRIDGASWFFIGLLLTDVEIDAGAPLAADHCGTCTACLEACPTAAILAPGVVDARRCISYTTIETVSITPVETRAGQGAWVHGCDACQDACPWNKHRHRAGHARFAEGPLGRAPLLRDLLRLDDAAFAALTPKSAVKREGRVGLVRNAAIAAGNSGDDGLEPELVALISDPAPGVRAHAAWALSRLGHSRGRAAVEGLLGDPDGEVRAEAAALLAAWSR